MCEVVIFFFARVMRAAMVDSLTRNARATSDVVNPHTSLSVSATCVSNESEGWQHVKMSRKRSSAIGDVGGSSAFDSWSGSMNIGSKRSWVVLRRSRSMARRRATVVIQAPGL